MELIQIKRQIKMAKNRQPPLRAARAHAEEAAARWRLLILITISSEPIFFSRLDRKRQPGGRKIYIISFGPADQRSPRRGSLE